MSGNGSQSKVDLRPAHMQRARNYILAHPADSKAQAALGTGLSESTIARARRELVAEGVLPKSRGAYGDKAPPPMLPPDDRTPETAPTPPTIVAGKRGDALLDHDAMLTLSQMIDEAVDAGDDEAIHKRLIKQSLMFAFRPDLHPDTRMSASQMWGKLKDMAKAKDLGPGRPMNRADAVRRTADVLVAVGPEITVEAVHLAFEVKDGQAQDEQAAPAGGPPQDASPAGHEGGGAPTQDMRPLDVEAARRRDDDGRHDLPGPAAGWPCPPDSPRTPAPPNAGSPWDQ